MRKHLPRSLNLLEIVDPIVKANLDIITEVEDEGSVYHFRAKSPVDDCFLKFPSTQSSGKALINGAQIYTPIYQVSKLPASAAFHVEGKKSVYQHKLAGEINEWIELVRRHLKYRIASANLPPEDRINTDLIRKENAVDPMDEPMPLTILLQWAEDERLIPVEMKTNPRLDLRYEFGRYAGRRPYTKRLMQEFLTLPPPRKSWWKRNWKVITKMAAIITGAGAIIKILYELIKFIFNWWG